MKIGGLFLKHQAAQWAVRLTSVLNRKNGSARRAELARKLRRRKAAESSFRDKVFIGFENLVTRLLLYKTCAIYFQKQLFFLSFKSGAKPRTAAYPLPL